MDIIDRDWLHEYQNNYAFKDRNDIDKFVDAAPKVKAVTEEDIIQRRKDIEEEIKCLKIRWQELGMLLDKMEEEDKR